MLYEFQLHPDLNILQQYNYISATSEDLEYAIQHNHGEAVCLDFIPGNLTKEEFVYNFLDVVEAYELMGYVNTLFYISLREVLEFDNVVNHAQDTYQSKKQAKQLAQLLRCFHETPPGRLQGLKLNTLTETVKVSDDKLIFWIGLVE